MKQIRTILAPTDFSERSARALDHAGALAVHFGSKLVCAHIIPPTPDEYMVLGIGLSTAPDPNTVAQIEARLRSLTNAAAPGCDVEISVLNGDPAQRIEELANERGVDLVVMATRGYGRFRRLLLGSVVSKVLHDVPCPILTGAHLDEESAFHGVPYRTVACALGLQDRDHSKMALRWAVDFANSWSAALHVIHVPPAIDWSAGEWFPDETQQLIREASREKLRGLLADVGCEAVVHTEGIEAVPYMTEVVRKINADVLVIGRSSGRGLIGGGGRAFAFIRESPCPVISV